MSKERFTTATPVLGSMADDDAALAELERHIRGEGWREAVEELGGQVVEGIDPELERVPNPGYGLPIYDLLDDDGEPLVDPVKFTIFARGWAVRQERRDE